MLTKNQQFMSPTTGNIQVCQEILEGDSFQGQAGILMDGQSLNSALQTYFVRLWLIVIPTQKRRELSWLSWR